MLSKRFFQAAGAALLALGLAVPASAQDGAEIPEINVSILAETCANCHGPEGRSPGAIPSIAGVPFEVLLAQLTAFKEGTVAGATVMTRIATGYSDEELEAIARFFSQIEP